MNPTCKAVSLVWLDVRSVFRISLAAISGALLVFGAAHSARAVLPPPTIDQQLIAAEQAGIAIAYDQSWGQTFTVGLPGALTQIDFQLGRNPGTSAPLQIELRKTSGGLPDFSPSALLFSGSIAASNVPVLITTSAFTVSLDLSSAPPTVAPGEQLAVLLTSADYDWYNWTTGYFPGDMYLGGSAIKLGYPNPDWIFVGGYDSGFRTWVAVPEPSGLVPIGLMILGLYRKRQHPFVKRLAAALS